MPQSVRQQWHRRPFAPSNSANERHKPCHYGVTVGAVALARDELALASILAAQKLAQYDGGKRVPATMSAIADAVRWAEEIMKEIDERWPTR